MGAKNEFGGRKKNEYRGEEARKWNIGIESGASNSGAYDTVFLSPIYIGPLAALHIILLHFLVPVTRVQPLVIMTESAQETATATPVAAKSKKAATPKAKSATKKAAPTHPPTAQMVNNAIKNLKERGGSSLQAIKKYISGTYKVDAEKIAPFIKKYLKSAVDNGSLIRTKGKGASGSFKLAAGKAEGTKKPAAKKPKVAGATKKAAKPKKAKATPKKAKAAPKPKVAKPKPAAAKKSPSKAKKVTKAPAAKKPKSPKPKKAAPKKAAAKKAATPKK